MLSALRFNGRYSAKFSPFYLLYGRGVILPLDNILEPHQLYSGDDHDKITLQDSRPAFTYVRSNQKMQINVKHIGSLFIFPLV